MWEEGSSNVLSLCKRCAYSFHEGKLCNDNTAKRFRVLLGLIFFFGWDKGITGKKAYLWWGFVVLKWLVNHTAFQDAVLVTSNSKLWENDKPNLEACLSSMCCEGNLVTEFSQDPVWFVQYPFVLIGKLFDILKYICNFNYTLILKKLFLKYLTTMKKSSSFKQSLVSLFFWWNPWTGRISEVSVLVPFFCCEIRSVKPMLLKLALI